MKKLLSTVLLITVLLSCCACGINENKQDPQADRGPSELAAENLYAHIDQTTPIDGYYKIWSHVGVKNMAEHPDGKFELLCDVDMGGATVTPIPDFTGTIQGGNFTISNFVLQGGDETDFGFVTVNRGKIQNLLLDKVSFVPGENARNIGSLAGSNENEILGCAVTGTLTVENAAADATCGSLAGISTGSIANTAVNVDVIYTATGAATVGGIVGVLSGGSMEFVDTNGALTVTGSNKVTGLIAGSAKGATLKSCAFIGPDNSLDGKLFRNYFGTEENVTSEKLLWRDNSRAPEDPKIQVLREKVVQAMYEICTIAWYPERNIPHTCNCSLRLCNGVYSNAYTWIGIPYNHKNGSLARMKYCLNEDGTVKDWVYEMAAEGTFDTFDLYMGNDSSTAVQQAWLTISNCVEFLRSSYQTPAVAEFRNTGMIPVGEWVWDIGLDVTGGACVTKNYTEYNGPQVMYEAYAQLRMGDGVSYYFKNGHSRMVATDPVVVRDENGKIDGEYSYIYCHEQGKEIIDTVNNTYSTCAVNQKYTFNNLYSGYYLPVTIEELVTGEYETPECILEGAVSDSRLGLTTGIVKANYFLDYVTMVITDAEGNEVFNHWMFPTVTKRMDNNSNDTQIRRVLMEYDLAGYAIPLREVSFEPGATYHAVITGNLATGNSFVVHDFSFTNGG